MPADANGYQDGLGKEEASRKVVDLISEHFGVVVSGIYRNTSLIQDLAGDSLDLTEITMTVEDELQFDYSIPDEVANSWRTVGDVADYVVSIAQKQESNK